MHLTTLPDEIVVHLCTFLCALTLTRLQITCRSMRLALDCGNAWMKALFTDREPWFQLKNNTLGEKAILSQKTPFALRFLSDLDFIWRTFYFTGAQDLAALMIA